MREEPAAHEHLVLAEIPTEKQKAKRNLIFLQNIGLCSDKLFEMKWRFPLKYCSPIDTEEGQESVGL